MILEPNRFVFATVFVLLVILLVVATVSAEEGEILDTRVPATAVGYLDVGSVPTTTTTIVATTTTLSPDQIRQALESDPGWQARRQERESPETVSVAEQRMAMVAVPKETTTTTTITVPTTTTVPWVHPCDLIPVPGPGPVLLTSATMSHCPAISPEFDPWHLFRALVTIECESNGDPYANRHWIGKVTNYPQGLFSILTSWNSRASEVCGTNFDAENPYHAACFASWLVYHTNSGWGHWASCNGLGVDETVRRYNG